MTKPLPNLWKDGEVSDVDIALLQDEAAERERIWKEKKLRKFSASEFHRLVAGVDKEGETKDQLIERLAKKTKKDLLELAERQLPALDPKLKNKEMAEVIVDWGIVKPQPPGVDIWPDGAETYVMEKVVEELTGMRAKPELTGRQIEWGTDTEPMAVQTLEEALGTDFIRTGSEQEFIDCNHEDFNQDLPAAIKPWIGATPDGKWALKPRGAEVKCPESTTHLLYLLELDEGNFKKRYTQAYWQCQGVCLITGWEAQDFESFDPRFKEERFQSLIIEIKANQSDMAKLQKRLEMAVERRQEILELLEKRIQLPKSNIQHPKSNIQHTTS